MLDSIERIHSVKIEHFVSHMRGHAVAIPVHIDITCPVEDGGVAVAKIGKSGQARRKVRGTCVVEPDGSIKIFAFV